MKNLALLLYKLAAPSWLLLGCAHGAPVPDTVQPGVKVFQIEVVRATGNGTQQPLLLAPDDPKAGIRAGVNFAITIEQDAPGYLYVVRSGATGTTRLYPELATKDAPFPVGRLRIPGNAAWLRVASLDSTDLLCVVASQIALAPADLSCQTPDDGERGEDRLPPPPPRPIQTIRQPPPPPRGTRDPDFKRVLLLPIQRTI